MEKIDYRKQFKNLYASSAKAFAMVEVPAIPYLMVDGVGNPNTSQDYQDAIEALYATSYAVKFASKKILARDYVVPPLEGLWWAKDMSVYQQDNKDDWLWTMMIRLPEWISSSMLEQNIDAVRSKKNLPALALLRKEVLEEGLSVQILHIGSYTDEAPTLARLYDEYMPQNGLAFNGKHHEIYLSDARKTAQDKLKTILRQPVRHTANS